MKYESWATGRGSSGQVAAPRVLRITRLVLQAAVNKKAKCTGIKSICGGLGGFLVGRGLLFPSQIGANEREGFEAKTRNVKGTHKLSIRRSQRENHSLELEHIKAVASTLGNGAGW